MKANVDQTEVILDRLIGLHPKSIDLGLERLERLLDRLGNPHHSIPPVIHVAGTNGKGSTCAFLRAMTEAAGLDVHVYSSPHLVHFRERIRLAGELVSNEALVAALLECERINEGEPITFFEITTAAAFLLFSRVKADLLILEVGLGGRLDATNVIDKPLVSVISVIAHDHENFLGSDIQGIAREKAGILKPECPAVFAPQADDRIRDVLEQEAMRKKTGPVLIGGQDWQCYEEHGGIVYHSSDRLQPFPMPRLGGRHQIMNAGLAIAALEVSGLDIPEQAIEEGLVKVEWPARLQRITEGALLEKLPKETELWLDGGHNPQAGHALACALADFEERSPKPLHMIVGMLNTKDPGGYFSHFKGLVSDVTTVPIEESEAAIEPMELACIAQEAGLPATAASSLEEAVKRIALLQAGSPKRLLIGGSLYLAGEALSANGTSPR